MPIPDTAAADLVPSNVMAPPELLNRLRLIVDFLARADAAAGPIDHPGDYRPLSGLDLVFWAFNRTELMRMAEDANPLTSLPLRAALLAAREYLVEVRRRDAWLDYFPAGILAA